MALTTRGRTRAAWIGLLLTALTAAAAGWSWRAKAHDNASILAGSALADRDPSDAGIAPELRFAQARELGRRQDIEPALSRYRSLLEEPRLSAAARYNSANLMMRQALVLRSGGAPSAAATAQAIAMIDLAKQGYRDVLRAEPTQWEARYNLERAQRLQPEPEDSDPSIAEPRNDAERAASKARGIDMGLP